MPGTQPYRTSSLRSEAVSKSQPHPPQEMCGQMNPSQHIAGQMSGDFTSPKYSHSRLPQAYFRTGTTIEDSGILHDANAFVGIAEQHADLL